MASDQQIAIEIKLEDGTFRKAFASLKTDAEKASKDAGESLTDGIGGAVTKLGAKLLTVKVAWEAVQAAFQAPFIAEEAQRIEAQFDRLTERSGILGSSLAAALEKSADGLVDNTDLLGAANKAMVELGSGAQKLPQFLDIARQATAVFGGSLIENFEKINFAVSTGNAKALKTIGLAFDQQKAFDTYAKSIGRSADTLSEFGKQQAMANALLAEAGKSFAGVDSNLGAYTNAWQRLKVSISDFVESSAKAFTSLFGDFLAKLINNTSSLIQSFSNGLKGQFGSATEQAAQKLKLLNIELENHEKLLAGLQSRNDKDTNQNVIKGINFQKEAISGLNAEILKLTESNKGLRQSAGGGEQESSVDPVKLKEKQDAFTKIFDEGFKARIESQKLGQMTIAEQDTIFFDQQLLLDQERIAKEAEITAAAQAAGLMTSQAYKEALLNNELDYAAKSKALKTQGQKDSEALSKAFTSGVVNVIVGGLHAIGEGLVRGGVGFDNFGKKVLGLIGGLASMLGQFMITTAIGLLALEKLGFGVLLGAGIALVILGGMLSGMSSNESPSGAQGASAAETGLAATSSGLEQDNLANQVQEPSSRVVVNIQGNVLDRKSTGIEIAEIIRENFDLAGVTTVGSTA